MTSEFSRTELLQEAMLRCSRCGVDKPEGEFWLHAASARGRQAYCKPCCRERTRERYDPATKRDQRLRAQYGISHDDYLEMLESQGGACAICGEVATRQRDGVLRVDHDHATGEVRGLLCEACNQAIGLLRDDPEIVAAAGRYLNV